MQADTSTLRNKKCWCKQLISLMFAVQRQITLHLCQMFHSSCLCSVGEGEKEERSVECWVDTLILGWEVLDEHDDHTHGSTVMKEQWQAAGGQCTVLSTRTYSGVITLRHCKRCAWLYKHSSRMWYWFATVRPTGDGTFESNRLTPIHVTSTIVLAHCSSPFVWQSWGCIWDKVPNLPRSNSFKSKKKVETEIFLYICTDFFLYLKCYEKWCYAGNKAICYP